MKNYILAIFSFILSVFTINCWAYQATWQLTNKSPAPIVVEYAAAIGDPRGAIFSCDGTAPQTVKIEPGKASSLTVENLVMCVNVLKNDKEIKKPDTWGASFPNLAYASVPFSTKYYSQVIDGDPCPNVTNQNGICDLTIPAKIEKIPQSPIGK